MSAEVRCPQCDGSQVRELTPGFFECTSQVLVGVVPPAMSGQPQPIPDYRACRHQFQVGGAAATPRCACGRYSIGVCGGCSEPLCGIHGAGAEAFLCAECSRRETQRREQTERQGKADHARSLEQAQAALPQASDPREIVRLLAVAGTDRTAGGSGIEWHAPCGSAWRRLSGSGALKAAEMELVRMRFRKPTVGGQEVTELWRRAAWSGEHEGERRWLDAEASLWREERCIVVIGGDNLVDRLRGRSRDSKMRAIESLPSRPRGDLGETSLDEPTAYVRNSDLLEKTFLTEVDCPVEITSRTEVLRERRSRYWRFSGGVPLSDSTDGPAIIAAIAAASLSG
jgi:hypothetical protein